MSYFRYDVKIIPLDLRFSGSIKMFVPSTLVESTVYPIPCTPPVDAAGI